MSKITRVLQRLFGSTAGVNDIGQFGSLANAAPAYTTDPVVIQSLPNFLTGWAAAIEGGNSPALEDVNALDFLTFRQLAYIFQAGIPEWETGTVYYIGSLVNVSGVAYVSLADNNMGNAVTDETKWRLFSRVTTPVTLVGGATAIAPVSAGDEDIYVKGNASAWVSETAAEANAWAGICYSPALNLYVAVSNGGTHRVMTSPDGITWTVRTASSAVTWTSVCWSARVGLFVAVAEELATTNSVMTSPDGITWTTRVGIQDGWNSVIWSDRLNLFIACGQAGSSGKYIMTSPDGATWTSRTAPAGLYNSIIDSPELGLLVAVASVGGGNTIITSSDGINWTARTSTNATGFGAVSWSKELGLFVAVSSDGTNQIGTSLDGITWADSAALLSGWNNIVWASDLGLFIAAASSGGTRTMFSVDGLNWNGLAAAAANTWTGLVYSQYQHLVVSVGSSGANRVQLWSSSAITGTQIVAGTKQAKRLSLIGSDNTAPVRLVNGNGIFCKKDIYLKKNSVANFIWDQTQSLYIEAR